MSYIYICKLISVNLAQASCSLIPILFLTNTEDKISEQIKSNVDFVKDFSNLISCSGSQNVIANLTNKIQSTWVVCSIAKDKNNYRIEKIIPRMDLELDKFCISSLKTQAKAYLEKKICLHAGFKPTDDDINEAESFVQFLDNKSITSCYSEIVRLKKDEILVPFHRQVQLINQEVLSLCSSQEKKELIFQIILMDYVFENCPKVKEKLESSGFNCDESYWTSWKTLLFVIQYMKDELNDVVQIKFDSPVVNEAILFKTISLKLNVGFLPNPEKFSEPLSLNKLIKLVFSCSLTELDKLKNDIANLRRAFEITKEYVNSSLFTINEAFNFFEQDNWKFCPANSDDIRKRSIFEDFLTDFIILLRQLYRSESDTQIDFNYADHSNCPWETIVQYSKLLNYVGSIGEFRELFEELRAKTVPKDEKDLELELAKEAYLRSYGIDGFYHFTHTDNVESINRIGGLVSCRRCEENKLIFTAGGSADSRKMDKGAKLDNYVRLSFCRDHPMAHRCRQEGYDLTLYKIDLKIIHKFGVLFSNMNALDNNAVVTEGLNGLLNVNLRATQRRFVSNNDKDFKPHQAEILVPRMIPGSYIIEQYDYQG